MPFKEFTQVNMMPIVFNIDNIICYHQHKENQIRIYLSDGNNFIILGDYKIFNIGMLK